MALVFKVKYQNTLRRWIASEVVDEASFSLDLRQIEQKIKELFKFPPTAVLAISYVDKENDIVTLGDDKDVKDACLIQRLNPVRLEVCVLEEATNEVPMGTLRKEDAFLSSSCGDLTLQVDVNVKDHLKTILPQVTMDKIKQVVNTFAPDVDLSLPLAAFSKMVLEVLQQFNQQKNDNKTRQLGCEGGTTSSQQFTQSTEVENNMGKKVEYEVHHGVRCDGCGVLPIEGPRYNSTKLPDYDLCSGCFEVIGKESEFQMLEHSVHPSLNQSCSRSVRRWPRPFSRFLSGRPSFSRGPYGWNAECPFSGQPMSAHFWGDDNGKLDSIFIRDVTVCDGTELAPCTRFTKIWCLRNSGMLPWPQRTQLVRIGGDALISKSSVILELPDNGLPCGQEIDVSVDFVAPERVGHYVSHWCLASPTGQKFGHRVWVEIQVIPKGDKPLEFQGICEGDKEMLDMANGGNMSKEAVKPKDCLTNERGEASSDEDDGAISASKDSVVEMEANQDDLEEVYGFSMVEKPAESTYWQADLQQEDDAGSEGISHDDKDTGFANQEVGLLLKNSESLPGMLDNPFSSSKWEVVLKELEDMGFSDWSMNSHLLAKHAGSIKSVVMELLEMEKAEEKLCPNKH